ncbi:MAG: hypothetical protein O7E51_00360, partial [Acidobacteria bacterium]|nr:hypothetical protein [Acidobacteriota bacterium]
MSGDKNLLALKKYRNDQIITAAVFLKILERVEKKRGIGGGCATEVGISGSPYVFPPATGIRNFKNATDEELSFTSCLGGISASGFSLGCERF